VLASLYWQDSIFAGVVDTAKKCIGGVIDTVEQFFGSVVDTGDKFEAFWLFLTSINNQKFIAGVNNTDDKH